MALYNGRKVTILKRIHTPASDQVLVRNNELQEDQIVTLGSLELTDEEVKNLNKEHDEILDNLNNNKNVQVNDELEDRRLEKEKNQIEARKKEASLVGNEKAENAAAMSLDKFNQTKEVRENKARPEQVKVNNNTQVVPVKKSNSK